MAEAQRAELRTGLAAAEAAAAAAARGSEERAAALAAQEAGAEPQDATVDKKPTADLERRLFPALFPFGLPLRPRLVWALFGGTPKLWLNFVYAFELWVSA